jgi:hypothetical protein
MQKQVRNFPWSPTSELGAFASQEPEFLVFKPPFLPLRAGFTGSSSQVLLQCRQLAS